jgi:hypothetical protein
MLQNLCAFLFKPKCFFTEGDHCSRHSLPGLSNSPHYRQQARRLVFTRFSKFARARHKGERRRGINRMRNIKTHCTTDQIQE